MCDTNVSLVRNIFSCVAPERSELQLSTREACNDIRACGDRVITHPYGDNAGIWPCRDAAAFASLRHQIQTDDYHIWAEPPVWVHTLNQCLVYNHFRPLIQICQLVVAGSLLERRVLITGKFRGLGLWTHRCVSSENMQLCADSKSQHSSRGQPIIPIFDCLKIKWFLLIFLIHHPCLRTGQDVITAQLPSPASRLGRLRYLVASALKVCRNYVTALEPLEKHSNPQWRPNDGGMEAHPKHKVEGKQEVFQADGSTCFLWLLVGPHAGKDSKY